MKLNNLIFIIFFCIPFASAQQDELTLLGGQIASGQTAQFPIYFRDVNGTGIDTGVGGDILGVGGFGLKLTVPAGMISSASFSRAGVLEHTDIVFEQDTTDLGENFLEWRLGFLNSPEFILDAASPGQLIGYLTLQASGTAGGQTIIFTPDQGLTYVQDLNGNVTNTLSSGLLRGVFENITITGAMSAPEIVRFEVTPSTINPGGTASLSWNVNGATTLSIDNGIGSVSNQGSVDVNPNQTTTYTLSASNLQGTVTQQVVLAVRTLPEIVSFELDTSSISPGESATLSWEVLDASVVSIDQGIGTVSSQGSRQVSPIQTSTFTITALNDAGSVTAQATLNVTVAPPTIVSFAGNPPNIHPGESTSLQWDVSGADLVSINQEIGSVGSSGTVSISPASTTVYQITASNQGGIVQAETTIFVSALDPPVIQSFSGNPSEIQRGMSTTLFWQADQADSILGWHDDDTEDVYSTDPLGSVVVSPLVSTTYFLMATNQGGNSFASTNITVYLGEMSIEQFSANPTELLTSEMTQLTWQVTNAESVEIQPNLGSLAYSGQVDVSVDQTTHFVLTAKKGEQTLTRSVKVTVIGDRNFFSCARVDQDWTSDLVFINVGDATVDYVAKLMTHGESLPVGRLEGQIASLESVNWELPALPGDGFGWVEIITGDISQKLEGIINVRSTDGEELLALSSSSESNQPVWVPHIASDLNFYTLGSFVNLSDSQGTFSFQSEGEAFSLGNLEGRDQLVLNLRDLMGGTVIGPGWGHVTSNQDPISLVGAEIFGRSPETGLRQSVGVTLDSETSKTLYFLHLAKDINQFWTGVVIINPDETISNSISYEVYNDNGTLQEDLEPEVLLPGQKKVFLVDQNRQDLGIGASWLKVNGEAPLLGYMLFGTYAPDDRFSGFQSTKSLSKKLGFAFIESPQITGTWTGIAFVNPNDQENALTLQLLDSSGVIKQESELTLQPRNKIARLTTDLFANTTILDGDKIIVTGTLPLGGFELYGFQNKTLGGVLAINMD